MERRRAPPPGDRRLLQTAETVQTAVLAGANRSIHVNNEKTPKEFDCPSVRLGDRRIKHGPGISVRLDVVRAAIAAEARSLLSEVLDQPVPAEMADLLKQLDEPRDDGIDADSA